MCFAVAFVFTGCSKDDFLDIYGFTVYYNNARGKGELSVEDFLYCNGAYSVILENEGTRLHLALEESEGGKIKEIRLLIPKTDENNNRLTVTESAKDFFCERLNALLVAYGSFTFEEAEDIIKEMSLDKLSSFSAEGELTLTKKDRYMVYYSNALASVFMVFNIHLQPIEKTEKPVSKPDFGNTAYTRAENNTVK